MLGMHVEILLVAIHYDNLWNITPHVFQQVEGSGILSAILSFCMDYLGPSVWSVAAIKTPHVWQSGAAYLEMNAELRQFVNVGHIYRISWLRTG